MAYAYYYDLPPPIVDHPHERTHQHQSLLQYLARRHPRPELHPNAPDLDVRDAPGEYLVEIEVPGLKEPKEVHVSYTSDRSILVVGNITRPDYGYPADESPAQTTEPTTAPATKEATAGLPPHGPYLLVGERRIGPFRRYINFPSDVENITVKLDAGVLKIRAVKKPVKEGELVGNKVDVHV